MKLVLLGTGGYFPNGRRHTACVLLPELGIVLDAGTGMFRLGDYRETDRFDIFLSHAHLDHVAGLTCLLNILPPDVLERTTLHGEAAKLDAVREHLFASLIFPVAPAFGFEPLSSGPVALPGGGKLTHFPLTHPGGSRGFRLDWPGHSLAYVTDTTASVDAKYVAEIRGVDLLIHEAYFAEENEGMATRTGHSSLLPVAGVAAAAAVRRLVLVHIDPLLDHDSTFDLSAARKVFDRLELGVDGAEFQF